MCEEREDGDDEINTEAAANFRKILKQQALETFDPLHQSLIEMEILAEEAGLGTFLDYDDDISDLDLEIF